MHRILLIGLILLLLTDLSRAQQSVDIEFEHTDRTVFGTLDLPMGDGPFPLVIINPGSGAVDRDGTLPLIGGNSVCLYPDLAGSTLTYYNQLAEALADSGYAVLRYDKLEFTYPTNLGEISFEKLWLPVTSAIDFAKTRSEVDTNAIVLLGHSEGSSIIPYISRLRGDVKALISVAGPRSPLDSLLAIQIVDFARKCNGDTIVAKSQASQILQYFDLIRSGQWNNGTPPLFGVPPSVWDTYTKVVDSVAINYNLNNLPTLFIGLGEDLNVPPDELERLMTDVNITEDFWSIDGLNHFMTPNDDPNVSHSLTDTIIYWLRLLETTSSLEDPAIWKINFDVFPNPFTHDITVNVGDVNGEVLRLVLRDITGRVCFATLPGESVYSNSFNLDLSDLPRGSYYLEVETARGKGVVLITRQ